MKKVIALIILVLFAFVETQFFLAIGDICPELDFILGQFSIIVGGAVSMVTSRKLCEEELEKYFNVKEVEE